ncbi:MAG: hypothetical protein Ta2D_11030 [Rickettsiales bacterium]|nr:MAG: hypothetical protein Ta2D_11030 [Rickettsiales bacterium]
MEIDKIKDICVIILCYNVCITQNNILGTISGILTIAYLVKQIFFEKKRKNN